MDAMGSRFFAWGEAVGRPRVDKQPANRGDRWQSNSLAAGRASQDADGAGTPAQTFFFDISGMLPV